MRTYVLDTRTATPRFPGIGRYVRGLAGALGSQTTADESVRLVTGPEGSPSSAGGRVSTVAVRATPFSLSQQWEVGKALRAARADVYHSPYLLMPLTLRMPTVLTAYDVLPLQFPRHSTFRARFLFRVALSLALRRADAVLVLSESAGRDLAAFFPSAAAKLRVIPPGVERVFRRADAAAVADVRRRHALPDRFVLFVGSARPHKNIACIRDACRIAGIPLVHAGAGGEPASGAMALGDVPDADLPALYSAAAVAAMPSLGEGFGFPVLEAMACSTPVACSDIPVLREVAGGAAEFFDPKEPESAASALRTLLSDSSLRAARGEAGVARAASFTWEKAAAATLGVYRRLAEEACHG